MTPTRRAAPRPPSTEAERRWRLEDERDFLTRSLADLSAERTAGDLDRTDFDALSARDRARLQSVEDELAELDAASAPGDAAALSALPTGEPGQGEQRSGAPGQPGKRRRPRWLAIVAAVALSAGATLLVVELASPRLPGQPETGGATQSLAQEVTLQLEQATILVNDGTATSLSEALSLYRAILVEDPNQPQALAELGYLEWEAGYSRGDASLESRGASSVERSLAVERDDSAAHLFLGTIELEQDHDPAGAVSQYRRFLAEHPPQAQVTKAAPLVREAFSEAGVPPPAVVAKG